MTPEDKQEWISERAAIMQYDGQLSPVLAQLMATQAFESYQRAPLFAESAPEPANQTQPERILALLGDGNWHCVRELQAIAWRYSARLHDLKAQGYEFEKRECDCANGDARLEHWRLTGTSAR